MKGFVKILEAIIASIILLTSLTFFFSTPVRQTGWDDGLLQLRAEDVLFTMVQNGTLQSSVRENNAVVVNSFLSDNVLSIMPPTIDYSLKVEGIPNPVIYIGCICNDLQRAELENMLDPLDFQYKGRVISMRVQSMTLASIREETDVLFSFDYVNLNPYTDEVQSFLENGGTLFVFGGLTQAQINDGYMSQTFNLTWRSGGGPSTGELDGYNDEDRITFKVAKYWMNVSGQAATATFNFYAHDSVESNYNTLVKSTGGSTFSHAQANSGIVNGRGRAVWLAPYDTSDGYMNNLTKSMMLWASGESFNLDVTRKIEGQRNMKVRAIVFDRDIYTVTLTVWRVFQ